MKMDLNNEEKKNQLAGMNCDFQCLNKKFFSYFLAFCDPNSQTSIFNYLCKNLTDTKLYLLICITVNLYKYMNR